MADDVTKRILNDPDFIVSPRHNYSLRQWAAAQKEEKEVTDPLGRARREQMCLQRAAKMLRMPVEDVEEVRDEAVQQLREELEDMR